MNDTGAAVGDSTPGLLADTAGVITTAHLILIVIFAVLVVVGILYGMRLKRQRVAAVRKVEADAEQAGVEEVAEMPDDENVARPPSDARSSAPRSSAPVAPAPPPLGDAMPIADRMADEPVAAAAPLEANPAMEAESAPTPAANDPAGGPVTQLKGLGPKVAARLAELGITTVGQIAALDDDAAARLDADLGPFSGRLSRDRWIEQARFLAADDRAGFEAVFGRL